MALFDRPRTGGSPRSVAAGDTWWYAAVAGEAAGSFSARIRIRMRRACLAAILLLTLTYAGLVLTATGRRWGNAAVAGRLTDPAVGRFLSEHPSLQGLGTLSLVLAVLLLIAVGVLRKRYARLGLALGTTAAALAVAELLQRYAPGPRFVTASGVAVESGFPSSPAVLALGTVFGLLLVVPHRLRSAAVSLGALWAVALGAHSVASGHHRPGDVIAADLLVLAAFAATVALLARKGKVRPAYRRGLPFQRFLLTVPVALLAIGGLAAGGYLLGDCLPGTGPLPVELPRIAHRCGQALAAGTGAATALGLLGLLRRVDLDPASAPYRIGHTVPGDQDPFPEEPDHEIS
ncbi:phosphatase PAP2 family protein [Streptomyces roseicoloratus]|uniref:phosphatase PAP2 family protein n=1 Tax=Streptomyces roseicoloratus TaxID=2508722 RepID=UPI001009DDAE|nr:phosphatase PAP2 family protein [Streptomyces roseicoloratus]